MKASSVWSGVFSWRAESHADLTDLSESTSACSSRTEFQRVQRDEGVCTSMMRSSNRCASSVPMRMAIFTNSVRTSSFARDLSPSALTLGVALAPEPFGRPGLPIRPAFFLAAERAV